MKHIFIILTLTLFACEDQSDYYYCPTDLKIPPETYVGKNILACKIDNEVWIGDQGYIGSSGFLGGTVYDPSFYLYQLNVSDEDGYSLKDEHGNFIKDSLYEMYFTSLFLHNCEGYKNTEFELGAITFENSQETSGQEYKDLYIKYTVWKDANRVERDVYQLNFDKPYTYLIKIDIAKRQATGWFSGYFVDYQTKKEIYISEGFFDMKREPYSSKY